MHENYIPLVMKEKVDCGSVVVVAAVRWGVGAAAALTDLVWFASSRSRNGQGQGRRE